MIVDVLKGLFDILAICAFGIFIALIVWGISGMFVSSQFIHADVQAYRNNPLSTSPAVRAEVVLRSHLTPQQIRDLDKHDWFRVYSKKGNSYKINRRYTFNIYSEKEHRNFCITIRSKVPVADQMLAQKLLIETNEELFLMIANRGARLF